SGIAIELAAAKLLADALAAGRGPWGYNVDWPRSYGALLAGSDLFRRFSATLDADTVRRLIRRGILSAPMMADALDQRPIRPPIRAVARAAVGLAREPALARSLGPVLARMRALEPLYARYPDDEARLPAWLDRLASWSGVPAWRGTRTPATVSGS
ncbi:MAG: hypothetical protein ABMB14_40530, partial [Myxococcota bacterium]